MIMGKNEDITSRLIWLRLKHFGKRGKRAFAKALDIPLSTYASYESGRVPPAHILVKISQITGCDLDWLMTGRMKTSNQIDKDPEISAILGRLEQLITNQPKAKQAITALIDLLTVEQNKLEPDTTQFEHMQSFENEEKEIVSDDNEIVNANEEIVIDDNEIVNANEEIVIEDKENGYNNVVVEQRGRKVIPIVGQAAAGLPAFWIENDTPIVTLEGIIENIAPDELEEQMSSELMYHPESQEVTGNIEIIHLAEPIEHYGLLIDGIIIADSCESVGKLFAVRIEGDSMEPLLSEGDIVIGDTGIIPTNGNLVIAELNDRIGALCKFYFCEGDNIRLSSNNRVYSPIKTKSDNLRWIYKVIGKIKHANEQID